MSVTDEMSITNAEKLRRFNMAMGFIQDNAKDAALWSSALSIAEAYCQQEFRKLIRIIEIGSNEQSATKD